MTGQLYNLYRTCFGDSDECISTYLGFALAHGRICTRSENGTVVSSVSSCPCSVEGRNAVYIFAAATLPDYRGRGHMRACLEEACDGADISVCIPASEELFGLYASLGFTRRTRCSELRLQGSGTLPPEVFTGDPSELYPLHRGVHTPELFSACVRCHLTVPYAHIWLVGGGYAAVRDTPDMLYADEIHCSLTELVKYTAKPITARLPEGCGDSRDIACIRTGEPLPEGLYINFLFN